jgi:quercetin dioxygenase-like cupin family protein
MVKTVVDPKEARTFVPAFHVGCTTRALLEEANVGCKNLSMLRSEFEVGGKADPHTHPFEQAYYILKGKAEVTIGNDTYAVKAGNALVFPPNVPHSIKNIGKTPMWLIAVNAPPK